MMHYIYRLFTYLPKLSKVMFTDISQTDTGQTIRVVAVINKSKHAFLQDDLITVQFE